MTKKVSLRLLRFGVHYYGGARHEDMLYRLLQEGLRQAGVACAAQKVVYRRLFRSFFSYLKLLCWAFRKAGADINIVMDRLALPALIRGLITRKAVVAVIHHFDRRDGKGRLLALYYEALFSLLCRHSRGRAALVVVSPYFHTFFRRLFPAIPVFLAPNLFDMQLYRHIATEKDRKMIFLGQYSQKNDPRIFELAEQLAGAGYRCWFSSLAEGEYRQERHYLVQHKPFAAYLAEMARSYCTVAFTRINEGWSRLSHESILVGTPVVGFARGGLGDLLRESNSYIVQDAAQAYELITGPGMLQVRAGAEFFSKYDSIRGAEYIKPLTTWLTAGPASYSLPVAPSRR